MQLCCIFNYVFISMSAASTAVVEGSVFESMGCDASPPRAWCLYAALIL